VVQVVKARNHKEGMAALAPIGVTVPGFDFEYGTNMEPVSDRCAGLQRSHKLKRKYRLRGRNYLVEANLFQDASKPDGFDFKQTNHSSIRGLDNS
jgi:hypothetical protein